MGLDEAISNLLDIIFPSGSYFREKLVEEGCRNEQLMAIAMAYLRGVVKDSPEIECIRDNLKYQEKHGMFRE